MRLAEHCASRPVSTDALICICGRARACDAPDTGCVRAPPRIPDAGSSRITISRMSAAVRSAKRLDARCRVPVPSERCADLNFWGGEERGVPGSRGGCVPMRVAGAPGAERYGRRGVGPPVMSGHRLGCRFGGYRGSTRGYRQAYFPKSLKSKRIMWNLGGLRLRQILSSPSVALQSLSALLLRVPSRRTQRGGAHWLRTPPLLSIANTSPRIAGRVPDG